jgi:hypothetical protein
MEDNVSLRSLRFCFVNVGATARQQAAHPAPGGAISTHSLNHGALPILASCFSDVFHVYSAKKFPGVCESTLLSKAFVQQGVKIPIRKDNANGKGGDDDGEDDLD